MDLYYPKLPHAFQCAVVETQGMTIYFRGAWDGVLPSPNPRTDFVTYIATLDYAVWAFVGLHTHDNGKAVAQAIAQGTCEAISNGSYKDRIGTTAWMLQDSSMGAIMKGLTAIPGHTSDQCAYQSELGGIFSIVAMTDALCKYYNITTGKVHIACNRLGPLTQCFAKHSPSPSTPHYDFILSIQILTTKMPINWHWHHVAGHQDDENIVLDQWATCNIQMDMAAKGFWETLHTWGHQPSSTRLPYEGWTL